RTTCCRKSIVNGLSILQIVFSSATRAKSSCRISKKIPSRCWKISGLLNSAKFSISFANELAKQFQLSTRGMFWKILSEYCELFVTRSALLSTWGCCPGLPVYATAMGSGQNIGTMRWQDRHRSSPTNQEKEMFRTVSARFMSNAANVTKSFINTDSHESGKQEIRKSKRIR